MTIRSLALAALPALWLAAPAHAQAEPDFGADSSPWANDGQCDDPRFAGAGMAAVPAESDRMADATDCRAAFEAGTVTLAGGAAPGSTAPGSTAPGGKGGVAAGDPALVALADFGDDSGEWANDGECDDRRFAGAGVASSLSVVNVGRDATDCQSLLAAGSVSFWDPAAAQAATQAAAVDFGDDAGEYPNDGECDDPRFEGIGVASGVSEANAGHDATDCERMVRFGMAALRDY